MTHFDQIYLVLTLVCMGLLFKIIRDGLHELGLVQREIEFTRQACEKAIGSAEAAQSQLAAFNSEAEKLAAEVRELEEKDQSMTQKIQQLEAQLGGKSRVQREIAMAKLNNLA